ncbi:MAG: hypothetical protein R3C19_02905 [Planctomycetaceae bacterium]
MKYLLPLSMLLLLPAAATAAENPATAIDTIRTAGSAGVSSSDTRAALASLTKSGSSSLLPILNAFEGSSVLAGNYLRNAFETIADAELKAGRRLPEQEILAFIRTESQSPSARRLAYEWLLKQNPDLDTELIPQMLLDPAAEFRRDAVALLIQQAESSDQPAKAVALFRKALQGAVHDDQVKKITEALRAAGEQVNLQKHFGFLTDWMLIGPFDNKDMKGFAVAYPPEEQVKLDARYKGQLSDVAWEPLSTDDDYGLIDIAKQLSNYKGSVMYAATGFESDRKQSVELRLGTPNAWKLWVNGKLAFEREEYHRSTRMDQYKVPVELNAGTNTILVKVCQNEQTDDWAQVYQFQLRVCDSAGSAVLPKQ